MSWRATELGPWPRRGPFRHLPPWLRPAWHYRPRACWTLMGIDLPPTGMKEEMKYLKWRKEALEGELSFIQERLKKLEELERDSQRD